MIHYELRCEGGHGFDGWFPSSFAFDRQAAEGLLACPVCASKQVGRAPMSPRLSSRRHHAVPAHPAAGGTPAEPPAAKAPVAVPAPPPPMPDQLRAVLQRIRAEVEQRCDYVGPRFAEAARAIHTGQRAAAADLRRDHARPGRGAGR